MTNFNYLQNIAAVMKITKYTPTTIWIIIFSFNTHMTVISHVWTYLPWHNNNIIVYISLGWIHITSVKSPIHPLPHLNQPPVRPSYPINQQNIIISAPLWWGKWAAARSSVEVSDPENQQSPLIRLPWRFFGHWHLPHSIHDDDEVPEKVAPHQLVQIYYYHAHCPIF